MTPILMMIPFFLHFVTDAAHVWMTMGIFVSVLMKYSAVTVMIVTHLQPHTIPNTIMKSSLNPWHQPQPPTPPRQYQPTLQGH